MAYRVEWTSRAEADVRRIVSYIANVLDSPKAVSEHLDAFLAAVDVLEETPEIYKVSHVEQLRRRNLRACFVRNYVLVFSIEEERVVIWRVFHMRQDCAKLLE